MSRNRTSRTGLAAFGLAAGVAACLAWAAPVGADVVTLGDANAEVVIDLASDAGMYQWIVDGVDHLKKQWFWFRVGDTGPEMSLDTLSLIGAVSSGDPLDPDPRDERLVAKYGGTGFEIEVDILLTGLGTGNGAGINESIKITRTETADLDFHFFQYADFDLDGDAADDSVEITGDPGYKNAARQVDDSVISENIATLPSQYAAAAYSVILDSLTNLGPDNLGQVAGPVTNNDLTWAFQWDFTLDDNDPEFIISKKKNLIPEPAALALVAAGGVVALSRRRRR